MTPADVRPGMRFLSLRTPERELVLTVEDIQCGEDAVCSAADRHTRYATSVTLATALLADLLHYQPLPESDDGEGDGIPPARRKEMLAGLKEEESR